MDVELASTKPLVPSTHPTESKPYDVSDSTRKGVNLGIVISSFIALGSLIVGSAILAGVNTSFHGNSTTAQVIPLGFNIIVSVCTDVLSYAHSVSLRWALYKENRLEYNSNLRLFTSTKTCKINRWPVNLLSAAFLIASYTAANQAVLVIGTIDKEKEHVISMNGIALLMLGAAFSGQIIIAVLCMRRASTSVWTWNSNAPNAALAMLSEGALHRRPGRGLMSVQQKHLPAQPQFPRKRQQAMCTGYRNSRYISYFLAFIVALNIGFAVAVFALSEDDTDDGGFLRTPGGGFTTDFVPSTLHFKIFTTTPIITEFLMYLFGMVFQSIITLTLHSVELIVNVSRDEAQWRQASRSKGAVLSSHGVVSAIGSWSWWILFVSKPLAQWLFGSAGMSFGQRAQDDPVVWFDGIPLIGLVSVMMMLSAMVCLLVYRNPKGPQPVAFGHLQTLVDLVDDWGHGKDGRLFWGSKEGCHVGTAKDKADVGEVDWKTCYD